MKVEVVDAMDVDDNNSQASFIEEGLNVVKSNENVQTLFVQNIAERETRFVRFLRIGLILILLAISTIASVSVYFAVINKEQFDFEDAFQEYSSKLTTEFQTVAVRRLGAIASFASSITSNTVNTNATWPFVTVPHYEAQVRHVAELANLQTLAFAPIVSTEQRDEWETVYVPKHIDSWIAETITSIDLSNGNTSLSASYNLTYERNGTEEILGYPDRIFESFFTPEGYLDYDVSNGTGPYMPLWQVGPFLPGVDETHINYDMNTDPTFDRNLITTLTQQKAALGRVTFEGYGEYGGNPTSGFYYPVLKGLSNDSPVVASLVTLIFWLPFFSNILPEGAVGIVGVLSNTCNQQFTFRIDGAKVTYISENDQHNSKYDYLSLNVSFSSLLTEGFENKTYLGFLLDDTGCEYTLAVYPSTDLVNKYKSSTPIIAAIVVLLIFLATSCLFVLYDRLVERRQRIVMKEAESSGAIVSSLFPAAYRERLMAAQANQNDIKGNSKTSNLKNLLSSNGNDLPMGSNDQPIADLFPECTVLFADIAGFTHWSSTREPVQVFCLLQEVYAVIDKVAKQYTVFKVETIGDCYMAVTGLPNPQPNHALLMARFAKDCLLQMRETTSRLIDSLGDDTVELSLRIGLHSGPVIAGILRGEKSRFQLFGDTVNTASRMESTGEKNRIQISGVTADLICDAGKGHWFIPREDLVDAKGKGKLQTFWLNSDRGPSVLSSATQSGLGNRDECDALRDAVDDMISI
jgi:class 3 adenylate cyclase